MSEFTNTDTVEAIEALRHGYLANYWRLPRRLQQLDYATRVRRSWREIGTSHRRSHVVPTLMTDFEGGMFVHMRHSRHTWLHVAVYGYVSDDDCTIVSWDVRGVGKRHVTHTDTRFGGLVNQYLRAGFELA